jgi:glutathione-independent formaldehyde dehydrogenase
VQYLSGNKLFLGANNIVVEEIAYPNFELNVPEQRRKCPHGAIVKLIATNICGSDLHMVRGRIPPKVGTVLGHEMTGEIVEVGPDVENFKPGDLVRITMLSFCPRSLFERV